MAGAATRWQQHPAPLGVGTHEGLAVARLSLQLWARGHGGRLGHGAGRSRVPP